MRKSFLKGLIFGGILFTVPGTVLGQRTDIGIYYGRFWAIYKYEDQGDGYRNASSSNWNNFPTITLNKSFKKRNSLEYYFKYTRYAQYFSTARHPGAFYSIFGVGHLGVRYGYAPIKNPKIEFRLKIGAGIGIMPDQYEGSFESIYVYPFTDSITRGTINRTITPIFPMISSGVDFTYKIRNRVGLSLQGIYQIGFIKITEYDIYYNNGSGNNDQRAKQWGKGDFYGIQLGIRYDLKK